MTSNTKRERGCLSFAGSLLSFTEEKAWDNELKSQSHRHHPGRKRQMGEKRNMPRGYGHIVGCDNLEKCDVIVNSGVKYSTVYAFSTELETLPRRGGGLLKLFRQCPETMHQKST